jgi:hypothetical protein
MTGFKGFERETLSIKISFKGKQARNNLRLHVTVRNNSKKPIGWDPKFSIFFLVLLGVNNDDTGLSPLVVKKKVTQTKKSLAKSRFIYIKPGKKMKRVITITKPFRGFRYDPEISKGWEEKVKYILPKRAKTVKIRCSYSGLPDEQEAFKGLFGFSPEKVGLLSGPFHSNLLILKFKVRKKKK